MQSHLPETGSGASGSLRAAGAHCGLASPPSGGGGGGGGGAKESSRSPMSTKWRTAVQSLPAAQTRR